MRHGFEDVQKLDRVLGPLVVNAFKFVEDGLELVHSHVVVGQDGEHLDDQI